MKNDVNTEKDPKEIVKELVCDTSLQNLRKSRLN